ncbi:hypothetical protein CWB85_10380 [Pseudoalteromonas sp. S1727]|uniref:hypothetical protein n=1 Tax=Pseudoalteromonas sp. S1727 TaxID=2066514 RepID=UPI0011091C6E|nr:hypothetical protein [Pseudoalteromonas sp. S1727]TMN71648.1 hypothetical protein CWB85_10380 [Pseudoalteromonas sp. S1727]
MKTPVKYFVSVAVILTVGCLSSSVNQHRDVAFWHAQHSPKSILLNYYGFIADFNAQLNNLPDPHLYQLALNQVVDAQFAWALRLLNNEEADAAMPFWRASVDQQGIEQRRQLSASLFRFERWEDLEYLNEQQLLPAGDVAEHLKLHRSASPRRIEQGFANDEGFLLDFSQLQAMPQCQYNVLMMTDHRLGLRQLNALSQRYRQHPQPRAASFCFSKPIYLGNTIDCQQQPDAAARCNWHPFIADKTWPAGFDFIVMMTATGFGNVQGGIMHLNSTSHYGLFLHELMHFNGFEDEYVLPAAKQAWLCDQRGLVAPNLFIANGVAPPKGWTLSASCQRGSKAYKPSADWSIMQYQILPLSEQYQQLWLQKINEPHYQPVRFADYFQQMEPAMDFITKMTNKNIAE